MPAFRPESPGRGHWEPAHPAAAAALRADIAACHALLCQGSRSFHLASLLLPRRVAAPAAALYAFCRLADDAVDLVPGASRGAAIQRLRERLDRAYAGEPAPLPADRAFAAVVATHAVPRALPEALIEGLAWDAEGRRYETLDELEAYAARVAGVVGAMMTLLMGVRQADAIARAADLGVAMQLTNIARDVGEDARAGRLYLPLSWMRDAGIAPEAWLAAPAFGPGLRGIIARLLLRADELYRRAEAGIVLLPPDCRPGIAAARLVYAEIGRSLEQRRLDSVSGRAVVSGRRKAWLLVRSLRLARGKHAGVAWPALPATQFLVNSVTQAGDATGRTVRETAWRRPSGVAGRALWVFELFQRLERQDRMRNGAGLLAERQGAALG
jgi:phytoene synthase